jgi:DNA replication and repair protein RecF
MHCPYLQLDDFRGYAHLEMELSPGISVFQGENASGKTSLLEAIYLLATSRSSRTNSEIELINIAAETYPGMAPFARVAAQIERRRGSVHLQLVIAREDGRPLDPAGSPALTRKRITINGVARRAVDLIGAVNVVLFTPQDLELVLGEPALRRRYLDITIAQVDHRYVRTLSHYNKLLLQRNALLRTIREQGRNPLGRDVREELRYWDEEVAQAGAYLVLRRDVFVSRLTHLAAAEHAQLAGAGPTSGGDLQLAYVSAVAPTARATLAADLAAHWAAVHAESELAGTEQPVEEAILRARIPHVEQRVTLLATEFLDQLDALRAQEVRRGVSLLGPHRDDLSLLLGGQVLASYGSRGQQRTAVLALKLAEVSLMRAETGDTPILLLDDIVSELDARRRGFLVRALTQPLTGADRPPQVLITTTDWSSFDPAFLDHVARYEIVDGELHPLNP